MTELTVVLTVVSVDCVGHILPAKKLKTANILPTKGEVADFTTSIRDLIVDLLQSLVSGLYPVWEAVDGGNLAPALQCRCLIAPYPCLCIGT